MYFTKTRIHVLNIFPGEKAKFYLVSVFVQVPQRTTSISPALVRKNSPNGGVGLGPRTGSQLIRAR